MSSQDKYYEITLALAAIFQASTLVHRIALTGQFDEKFFYTLIQSIYKTHAQKVLDVYESENNLRLGLEELVKIFTSKIKKSDQHITRYVFNLTQLTQRMLSNKEMIEIIRRRVKQGITQIEYFSIKHPIVISNLADIYENTISTLYPRIQVIGKAEYLNNPENINVIRALFFTGIRAAVLWQQAGGKRWQLFFTRQKILKTAQNILIRCS